MEGFIKADEVPSPKFHAALIGTGVLVLLKTDAIPSQKVVAIEKSAFTLPTLIAFTLISVSVQPVALVTINFKV